MPVSHYNILLSYLKKEQEQYKKEKSLAEANKFKM